jgi:hypothetical protein
MAADALVDLTSAVLDTVAYGALKAILAGEMFRRMEIAVNRRFYVLITARWQN